VRGFVKHAAPSRPSAHRRCSNIAVPGAVAPLREVWWPGIGTKRRRVGRRRGANHEANKKTLCQHDRTVVEAGKVGYITHPSEGSDSLPASHTVVYSGGGEAVRASLRAWRGASTLGPAHRPKSRSQRNTAHVPSEMPSPGYTDTARVPDRPGRGFDESAYGFDARACAIVRKDRPHDADPIRLIMYRCRTAAVRLQHNH
jgi:hypothetical protein